jgi:hypothetical protein
VSHLTKSLANGLPIDTEYHTANSTNAMHFSQFGQTETARDSTDIFAAECFFTLNAVWT